MSNKRITDLTELTTPTTDDVFPVVDIASNTTTKVQLGNLPVPTAVTTALATKQDTLVSGTNIKTVNSTSLVGSGNVAVQETLVSGTNIKTLNSTSLLGSGNIVLTANPSGVAGAIQFSNGSAFASDAANLFWDDTNNRLGVGTNSPTATIQSKSAGDTNATLIFKGENSSGNERLSLASNGQLILSQTGNRSIEVNPGGYVIVSNYTAGFNVTSRIVAGSGSALAAQMGVVGSGSTSATTSLLVQNSAGTAALQIKDDLSGIFAGIIEFQNNINLRGANFTQSTLNMRFVVPGATKTFLINADYGDTNAPSAMLEVQSTTKGFLPPKMTTTQRNAISSPAAGLMIYNTTTNKLNVYTTAWEAITSL